MHNFCKVTVLWDLASNTLDLYGSSTLTVYTSMLHLIGKGSSLPRVPLSVMSCMFTFSSIERQSHLQPLALRGSTWRYTVYWHTHTRWQSPGWPWRECWHLAATSASWFCSDTIKMSYIYLTYILWATHSAGSDPIKCMMWNNSKSCIILELRRQILPLKNMLG